ncbi:MAG TPA: hypothetical protein VGW77_23350 [Candidatus Binatia bacterium]|nr:hypothetical protein [Candidatus Binatia bacterium]
MPAHTDQREVIATSLKALESQPLEDASRRLFAALGYESDRRIPIHNPQQFREQLDPHAKLSDLERDALDQVNSLHLLFQLTNAELDVHSDLFDDAKAVHATKIESYLFFAVDLRPGQYTRTALATLVRAVNKPLPMPALVFFRHGDTVVSLGMIHRRLHKRDQARDVLEKVTLIKDIAITDPIRAHLEILNDFVLKNLDNDFDVSNFVRLAKTSRLLPALQQLLSRDRRLVFLGASPGRGWYDSPAAALRHRAGKITFPDPSAYSRHFLLVPGREAADP